MVKRKDLCLALLCGTALVQPLYALAEVSESVAADKKVAPIVYTTKLQLPVITEVTPLKGGTSVSSDGHTLGTDATCFLRDGKPWYPVMGEVHYSRLPRSEWESSLLKMKASGIDVIASYLFWNYHEEEMGKFDWAGDRDVRAFAELCRKHGLYFFVRIGPWCHGEVRYGGLPDWVQSLPGGIRKTNAQYLRYVERFFNEIGGQLSGLYFKDGGPIIGAQIENEYRFNNPQGLNHILELKHLAIKAGIDVPYYTATGWPGSNLKQRELLPVWGAYPDAPWSKGSQPLKPSENYLFGPLTNDPLIGSDHHVNQQQTVTSAYPYPFATAEMGGGNQVTYHRRPVITAEDVVALAYTKIGSGANLMGYYMYHGGSNKIGKNSTLQESKATRYPNDYPIISYDFYSPLGEWGQARPSLREFKILHTFLNDFGDRLALTSASFPEKLCTLTTDTTTLRMAVRSDGESGFVFIHNHQRDNRQEIVQPAKRSVAFAMDMADGTSLQFPTEAVTVDAGAMMVLPFNFRIEDVLLSYATAQPVMKLKGNVPVYVFTMPFNNAELCFDAQGIKVLKVDGKKTAPKKEKYMINCASDDAHELELEFEKGGMARVLLLTHEQARNCYKIDNKQFGECLYISSDEVIPYTDGSTVIRSTDKSSFAIDVYPLGAPVLKIDAMQAKTTTKKRGLFTRYEINLPAVELTVMANEVTSEEIETYVPSALTLPEDNRVEEFIADCPGPQYFVNFRPVEGSRYWTLQCPVYKDKPNISNAFLQLNYIGDTGSLYLGGALVADDYYAGEPMLYSLERSKQQQGEWVFQVVPYRSNLHIFWEKQVRERLNADDLAELNEVKVLPVYEIQVR